MDVKPRNIRELRKTPISEMNDEEIVKAAIDRLHTDCAMLVYNGEDNKLMFIGRYKKTGRTTMHNLKMVCEKIFGKFKSLEE